MELVPRAHDGCREIQPDFSQIISQQQPSNQLPLNLSSHSDCSRGHAEDVFDLTTAPITSGSLPPGFPPPLGHNPNVLVKKRQIVKDAVQILRDSIGVALHSLAVLINPSGASSDTTSSASEEQMPELTPIQLSKLLFIIISDTPITFTEEGKETKLLWTPTVQPATVQAIVSWAHTNTSHAIDLIMADGEPSHHPNGQAYQLQPTRTHPTGRSRTLASVFSSSQSLKCAPSKRACNETFTTGPLATQPLDPRKAKKESEKAVKEEAGLKAQRNAGSGYSRLSVASSPNLASLYRASTPASSALLLDHQLMANMASLC
ncbi:hypothetical protein PCANC_02323 [Puccinia coronata f. sp. avenae]|uniref:Uncharacterized protein n=1 Tax=Puccinia coronata f. sp. avenae TaxID=200324 RepID=A0A2N5VZI3_9BASI|nr:hypothetical protein PCANC_25087 [Puccinia coronata f. sp. avenae]PLW55396.1 hypothetical protein PCANC_02323 [Puccinia coronata f. sp. avenae]